MKIESVRIQNFRSFEDETIFFNNYTCLVGPNGSGKSTILCALNIFFRNNSDSPTDLTKLDREDFHNQQIGNPIKITITFIDLSGDAEKDLKEYFRQGKLIVSAVAEYDKAFDHAEVKHFGQRLAMKDFAGFFEALGDKKSVAELKEEYKRIQKNHRLLPPPGTKDQMVSALRDYEEANPDKGELISSEDQFYGFSKGKNKLDPYIQWLYVPAVKDASSEQIDSKNSVLAQLLSRTVRSKVNFDKTIKELRDKLALEYQAMLGQSQDKLKEIQTSLSTRLAFWAHPNADLFLEWRQDPEKTIKIEEPFAQILVKEGNFQGELSRFGHGFQRSYLLALLQELSGCDDPNGPRLILGCEEPEMYQHPPQIRHLFEVFQELSEQNSQIVVCSHSPYFVSGKGFENVRLIRQNHKLSKSNITFATYSHVAEEISKETGEPPIAEGGIQTKINQALQPNINEIFFSKKIILVEGLEDMAYITTYLHLSGLWSEFRKFGCHIIPTGGKSLMIQPLVILNVMEIPKIIIVDGDKDKIDIPEHKIKHEKDNKAILNLCNLTSLPTFPDDTYWESNLIMWKNDLTQVVKQDIGKKDWENFQSKASAEYGAIKNIKKTTLHIGKALNLAWEAGFKSPNLEKLCKRIIQFGENPEIIKPT